MVKPLIEGKPPILKKRANGRITLTRQYELITPLFGGGSEANVVDVDNPIKGTAVRGHLRFWWRATRGGRFDGDLKKMKACEDEIFGMATMDDEDGKRQLPVQIAIHIDRKGEPDKPFINNLQQFRSDPNEDSIVHPYVAFPLQLTKEEIRDGKQPHTVQKNIAFTLDVNFHTGYQEDVEMALWAWETFGGIGARTRRGFGSLHCTAVKENGKSKPFTSPPCNMTAIKKDIKEQLKKVTGKWPKGVPHLSSKMFLEVMKTNGDAEDAWNLLIRALQSFRQSREGNDYGPTHWPEANAIRVAAGETKSAKSPDIGTKFPRAQLGLPILFHFPLEPNLDDATLSGATKERMASRLILRPLICGSNGAVGLAIALAGSIIPDGGLALNGNREINGKEISHKLSASEASKIVPLDGTASLITAFFNYIRS